MVELTYGQCQQLFNINALLTQSLDERSVLRNLMKAAMDLVKRADTIIIYEWDEDGYLTFSDGIGLDVEAIRQVKFRAGESITGKAYQEKRVYNVVLEQAKTYMQNMSPENAAYFQRAVYHKEVQCVLAVPLIYQDSSIGVLVVDNFDTEGDVFSEEETVIINILANQAAIALTNSRFYHELQRRNADLLTIQDIHHKFSAILLEGKGIKQIVDVLNRIVASPITYDEKADADRPLFLIVSSNEVLGYFHLSRPYETYSSLEKVAIDQAATAVVLELIKQNNLFERENKLKDELFNKLMEGTLDHRMSYYSKFNKLTNYKSVTCILLEGRQKPLWINDSLISKERVLRQLENALHRIDPDVIVFNRGFTVLVLAPKLTLALSSSLKELANSNFDMVIGIGRSVHVQKVGESYREANDALQLAKKSRERHIIRYEELGFERLWHGTDQDTLRQYVLDHLGPVLHGDPIEYETLQTYLELNGRHKETAQQLSIHQNTLSYRLKKIEDALSVDLRNHKDLLRLMTAFDILDYLPDYTVSSTN